MDRASLPLCFLRHLAFPASYRRSEDTRVLVFPCSKYSSREASARSPKESSLRGIALVGVRVIETLIFSSEDLLDAGFQTGTGRRGFRAEGQFEFARDFRPKLAENV